MIRTAALEIEKGYFRRAHGSADLFDCPVLKLVHHVFETAGPRAFTVLRRPIVLDFDPDPLALSLIQVMAKRWSRGPIQGRVEDHFAEAVVPALNLQQRDFMDQWVGKTLGPLPQILVDAEALVSRGEKRFESSRPIATFLTDESFRVLALGWNLRSQNRLWHAELVALKNLSKLKLDRAAVQRLHVFTSLQPCRMCAAYILATAKEHGVELIVRYLRPDDGPKAKNTGLEAVQSLL